MTSSRAREAPSATRTDWYFNEWVYDTRIPQYKFAYKVEQTADGKYQVSCKVKQLNVADDFQMVVPLYVELLGGGTFKSGEVVDAGEWVDSRGG